MKARQKQLLVPFFILTLLLVVWTGSALAITKAQIIQLTELEVPASVILKKINKDRTIFKLSPTDIYELKKKGVDPTVINLMLSSPEKFKKKGTKATTTPKKTEPTMTPEMKAAQEERMRQEAQRLAEQLEKRRARQRKAYAQGVLKKGKQLADKGRFVESIKKFQRFLSDGSFAPGSEEYIIAHYGIANALVKAGLTQAAAETLVQVLIASDQLRQIDAEYEAPFFVQAFKDLRRLRQTVGYSPPELEQLTTMDPSFFGAKFQDEFYYVLGEFFYESQRPERAEPYFNRISDRSPDYPKALYLKALQLVDRQQFRSAAQMLQEVVVSAERNGTEYTVIELAYLALARIAYANNDYYAAVFYYRKINVDSVRAPIAFFESAWSYFLNGDRVRALGMFHALHSPALNHYFYPELWILEATIYLNSCHYKEARKALDMFNDRVAVLAIPLTKFLQKTRKPQDAYKAVIETVGGSRNYDLPVDLTKPLLADVLFYNYYRTIRQIEKEQVILNKVKDDLAGLKNSLLAKLATARASTVIHAGIRVQQMLRAVKGDIDKYSINVTEIEIDLSAIEMEAIDEETRRLMAQEQKQAEKRRKSTEGALAVVGSDSMAWPFEGEYWVDEIPYYRAMLKDRCAQ
tara:strand:- start:2207 stop:4108 length:1902 start_codon:yes stop_codon:yes gene_type:complete